MKALVTGAAGFVGSAISRRLVADGHSVVGVDSITDYYDPAIKRANLSLLDSLQFNFVEGDLNEIHLGNLIEDVEVIFHQAGQPGVRKSWGDDFSIYTRQNINATQRLLEAAKGSRTLRRFVYASSSSIYGDAELYPTKETVTPKPVSPYGVTKLAAEHLCSLYATNFGLPAVALRYFTVYGPGQRPDMAFTRFCRAALTGETIQIYGDGKQVRDFTYIDDVVQANMMAAVIDTPPGSIFNVAGGTNVSVNDVLGILKALSGKELKVEYLRPVPGDVRQTGGSTWAIQSALGWTAGTNLADGLRNQLDWAGSTFTSDLIVP